ncbi:MAG: hypothetical protein K9M82_02440 [Deltaproteobacteria bacterium]|nr:hypothetical protein [Deltaproteobacteria bacterium]
MLFKVIELDQRTSEEAAVARFEGEDAEKRAEIRAEELREKACKEGWDHLRYWVTG